MADPDNTPFGVNQRNGNGESAQAEGTNIARYIAEAAYELAAVAERGGLYDLGKQLRRCAKEALEKSRS